jgi:hypothetical protein
MLRFFIISLYSKPHATLYQIIAIKLFVFKSDRYGLATKRQGDLKYGYGGNGMEKSENIGLRPIIPDKKHLKLE